jgi:hypothetical protein
MNTRPTPEQIADEFGIDAHNLLARLDHHGYVIVHPDDARIVDPNSAESTYNGTWGDGWNACRQHIFGDDDE